MMSRDEIEKLLKDATIIMVCIFLFYISGLSTSSIEQLPILTSQFGIFTGQ